MCLWLLCLLWFQEPADIREQLEVTYRQIQVRVLDREERPVRQLTASDFILLVNGQPMAPQSFQEVGAELADAVASGQAPAAETLEASAAAITSPAVEPAPPRSVAILLDPGMASVKGFQTMRQSALDLLDRLPPDTRVAVYQMHGSLRTLSTLTQDREVLRRQVAGASYHAALWNSIASLQSSIARQVEDIHTGASNIESGLGNLNGLLTFKGQLKDGYAQRLANALGTIGRIMAPLSGERSIYLLTAGGYNDAENASSLRYVSARLNWENIPVHALHFRDQNTQELNSVSMSRLSELDLQAMQNTLSKRNIQRTRSTNALAEQEDALKTAPRTWAQETGGTFVSAFNPLQAADKLARLEQAAAHYYLISYRTTSALDEVELRLSKPRPGWDLRYGRTRGKLPTLLGPSRVEQATDFATTLLYGFPHHDTDVAWSFQHFRLTDGTWVFPVLARVEGTFPEGGYELGLVALDEQGAVLDERKAEIRKPGAGPALEFYDLLATRGRPTQVRAMLREKKSGQSSLEEWFLDPQYLEATGLSSLVLVPPGRHEVFPIHALNRDAVKLDKQKIPRERLDPLIKQDGKRIAMTCGPFSQGQPLGLYFHAQRLDGGLAQYQIESVLVLGEEVTTAPLRIVKVEPLAPDGAELMAVLDTSQLRKGDYRLVMRLTDKRTGTTTGNSEQPFRLR